jgi:hypothetical protein
MAAEILQVGVIVERRPSASAWANFSWHIAGVLPDPEERAPWTELRREDASILYFAGSASIELHSAETANYRDNLASPPGPSLWVALRPREEDPGLELALVTADPAEGEAMTEAGDLIVEAIKMPDYIARRLAAFVEAHHVERAFVKRARD